MPDSPHRTHRRRLPFPFLGALLVLVVALGACTSAQRVPTSYGDTTRNNFIAGCVKGLKSIDGAKESLKAKADEVCTCTYAGIVEKIPYDEFKSIYQDYQKDPGGVPPKMKAISEECAADEGAYTLPAG